jgi:membrane associated rhomboid family serine protease
MGLYDREYVRDEPQGFFVGGARSMVTNLILVNVAVFVLEEILGPDFSRTLILQHNLLREPWRAYELLTYGFLHADIPHILWNMLGLWMFGREIETIYGKLEFLRLYLAMIVFGGIVWAGLSLAEGTGGAVLGASGAVWGVLVLFALHFPRREILAFGIIPMPAWAACVFFAAIDLLGFRRLASGPVAVSVHFAGAAFAFLYFRLHWNLGRLTPRSLSKLRLPTRRPSLRIHDPEVNERDLGRRVDEILAKISSQGESSLTREERRILEDASRRYQQRRR